MKRGDNYFGYCNIYNEDDNVSVRILNMFPLAIGMTLMHEVKVYQIDIGLFNKLKFGLNITLL